MSFFPLHPWYTKRSVFKYHFKIAHYLGSDSINPAKTLIALTKLALIFCVVTFLKYDTLLFAIIGMSWRAHWFNLTCA